MRFDTKLAIVVRGDLPTWQKLNMTAFLASGIAATRPESIGLPYGDASGRAYAAMFRQPVMVLSGSAQELRAAFNRACERGRFSPTACSRPATTPPTARRSRPCPASSSHSPVLQLRGRRTRSTVRSRDSLCTDDGA